jgi:hypothetical protein
MVALVILSSFINSLTLLRMETLRRFQRAEIELLWWTKGGFGINSQVGVSTQLCVSRYETRLTRAARMRRYTYLAVH